MGLKDENATYMMPLDVQKKHSIEKFIVIQVLDSRIVCWLGIYDPQWGLTLPYQQSYEMEAIKAKYPKTLNVFRGNNRQRQNLLYSVKKYSQKMLIFLPKWNII